MDRTGRPEQVQAPALRSIIRMIDMAIENGSLDPQDRDEVIQMFISGPTTVVDNKAGGGMMNMDEMIRPIGFANGGVIEDASDLSTSSKRLLLKKSLIDDKGSDSLKKMYDLDRMSPVQIEIEFQKLMGVEE